MKKLSIILTTLIFLTACTAQEKQEDILIQIASSQEYAKLKDIMYLKAELIVRNQVDLDGIKLILDTHMNDLQTGGLEAIGKDAFSQAKGGVMWYENTIEGEKRIKALDAKYQFASLSREQVLEISRLYDQIAGGKEKKQVRDAAFQNLQNRQK